MTDCNRDSALIDNGIWHTGEGKCPSCDFIAMKANIERLHHHLEMVHRCNCEVIPYCTPDNPCPECVDRVIDGTSMGMAEGHREAKKFTKELDHRERLKGKPCND